jgi:hypothetical protein
MLRGCSGGVPATEPARQLPWLCWRMMLQGGHTARILPTVSGDRKARRVRNEAV